MNVQEMLEGVGFDDIWVYVMAEYCRERTPDEAGRAYVSMKKMYGDLLSRSAEENTDNMVLMVRRFSKVGIADWDTAAYCGRDGQIYSLSFVDWDKVLGYEMLTLSIEEYGHARTAAHFLWELSKDGFTENEMREHRRQLDAAVDTEPVSLEELDILSFLGDDETDFRSAEDEENEAVSRRFENAAKEQINRRS